MRKILSIALLAFSASVVAQQTFTVSVSNPSKSARADEPVVINLSQYGDIRSALVTLDGNDSHFNLPTPVTRP